MAVDRKQQMKEITERLEQGVKNIFTSEMYTTYSGRHGREPDSQDDDPRGCSCDAA